VETHSKLVLSIQENSYYDEEEWRQFIAKIIDDFGGFGVKTCYDFLVTDPNLRNDPKKLKLEGNFLFVLLIFFFSI
jgi:hypothetical protein